MLDQGIVVPTRQIETDTIHGVRTVGQASSTTAGAAAVPAGPA